MKKYNKSLMALAIGLVAVMGTAGVASARWGGHGGWGHGGGHGCGYGYGMAQPPSPEAQKMMEQAYTQVAPKMLELRAKQEELTAKIYGGGDEKTIGELTRQVERLYTEVTEAQVKMQQQFAKSGIPMHHGGGYHYGGGPGWHRGMMGPGPAVPPRQAQ